MKKSEGNFEGFFRVMPKNCLCLSIMVQAYLFSGTKAKSLKKGM